MLFKTRMLALSVCLALFTLLPAPAAHAQGAAPADTGAPVMINPGFECGQGYHPQPGISGPVPNGWTAAVLNGSPYISNTQVWGLGKCDPAVMWYEKLEGYDSLIMLAYPPGGSDLAPPFDAAVYQRVAVTPGTAYSLSAWMVSLCGGSAMPNDCPAGYYLSKLAGLDATGGTDARAATVGWVEDWRPHYTARWVNLVTAATAQNDAMTVFVRLYSPFYHHGNHGFADAVKLVRAPSAQFTQLQLSRDGITVAWAGSLGPDIAAIPNGNYRLYFEVEVAAGAAAAWYPWRNNQPAGSAVLSIGGSCVERAYRFRVRVRAEQSVGEPGARPNHRFIGVWEESPPVRVAQTAVCDEQAFLPMIWR